MSTIKFSVQTEGFTLHDLTFANYTLARDSRYPSKIPALSCEITDCCILKVTAGTNGFCGGDSGHGGECFLELYNAAAADMSVSIDGKEFAETNQVVISFGGDAELQTFIEALEAGAQILRAFSESNALRELALKPSEIDGD